MSEQGKKLSMDDLSNVSGGAVFNSSGLTSFDHNNPFEVLDDKGNVVCRKPTLEEARREAANRGLGTWEADWNMVQKMRSGI